MSKKIVFKKDFVFDNGKSEYQFQLKKKNHLWLWLLLVVLFVAICCIRCERAISVTVVDDVSGDALSNVEVTLSHIDYYIYKDGKFFGSELQCDTLITDADGRATFEMQDCSVFSYIFCAFTKAEYTAIGDCHHLDPSSVYSLFHYTWNQTLRLVPNTTEISWHIYDKETKESLAGASVVYRYQLSGTNRIDSVKSDAAGKCVLKGIPSCGHVTLSKVSCYGFEDAEPVEYSVPDILADADTAKTELVPLKTSFSYFVKNKNTNQPVAGATVDVVLTSGSGKKVRGQSQTNVDGKGRGAYDDAFIRANLNFTARKVHYKEGHYDREITVDDFKKLPDSDRVIYLEPEPYMEEFQNVDSITGAPVIGAANAITVASNGKDSSQTEISNRNGVFYVKAREGDKIHISSTHDYYEPKETDIESFAKGEIIRMTPKRVNLNFRTIDAEDGSLLDDCILEVSTSRSHVSDPHNSGNGEFSVAGLYVDETISIIASKFDYGTNAIKIHEAKVSDLMNASQDARDIPLALDLEPCNASNSGASDVSAGSVSTPQAYNMGQKSGRFEIKWSNGGSCPDKIDVYNHNPGENYSHSSPIFTTGMTAGDGSATIQFSKGSVITIIVTTGPDDGSSWSYNISCPN